MKFRAQYDTPQLYWNKMFAKARHMRVNTMVPSRLSGATQEWVEKLFQWMEEFSHASGFSLQFTWLGDTHCPS